MEKADIKNKNNLSPLTNTPGGQDASRCDQGKTESSLKSKKKNEQRGGETL